LEVARLDVTCLADVKDIDLAVLRGGKVCAAAESVAGEDEELVVAEGLDLGLSSGTGLAAGFLGGLWSEDGVSIYLYIYGGRQRVFFSQVYIHQCIVAMARRIPEIISARPFWRYRTSTS